MQLSTREIAGVLILMAVATPSVGFEGPPSRPKNFIYFGRDRERIAEPAFLKNKAIAGAQLRYSWKELEPSRDRYALENVRKDAALLEKHGKRLFIQIQDASFSEIVPIPDYLRVESEFGGGAERKLESNDRDPSKVRFDGWVARRWDARVRDRFIKLMNAIGKALDGRIEGINLAETAIGFEDSRFHPRGFTFESYETGVKEIMTGARKAFPRSQVIQYANFMPGDSALTPEGPAHLRGIYAHAQAIGVGVGGPDILPFRKWQQSNSLPLIAARASGVIAGMAVQDGNLDDLNPSTGARVSVQDLHRYAAERLRLDYIFWGTQEPYYSEAVVPFLGTLFQQIER